MWENEDTQALRAEIYSTLEQSDKARDTAAKNHDPLLWLCAALLSLRAGMKEPRVDRRWMIGCQVASRIADSGADGDRAFEALGMRKNDAGQWMGGELAPQLMTLELLLMREFSARGILEFEQRELAAVRPDAIPTAEDKAYSLYKALGGRMWTR